MLFRSDVLPESLPQEHAAAVGTLARLLLCVHVIVLASVTVLRQWRQRRLGLRGWGRRSHGRRAAAASAAAHVAGAVSAKRLVGAEDLARDGPRLGLYVGRLVGQRSHLDLPLGARPGGSDGDRPELVLRRDKLLLKRDVRGGEPLVVDEELLDVLVPGDEALLDKGEGRVRGGCARGGGARMPSSRDGAGMAAGAVPGARPRRGGLGS